MGENFYNAIGYPVKGFGDKPHGSSPLPPTLINDTCPMGVIFYNAIGYPVRGFGDKPYGSSPLPPI
jgi:hypothetical protein